MFSSGDYRGYTRQRRTGTARFENLKFQFKIEIGEISVTDRFGHSSIQAFGFDLSFVIRISS
jgi:hypothetical protein